jgi:biotin carboxyl carrier protein
VGHHERGAAERLADHASISRLADELLPALMAKLGASSLGEIEVAEGDWKVRLRRPASPPGAAGRRATDRTDRIDRPGRPSAPNRSSTGEVQASGRPALTAVGPGRSHDGHEPDPRGEASSDVPPDRDPYRAVATSPAVGYYQPRPGVIPGSRIRSGDPIGAVDVLGIPQEVVAPADGIVGASLVEPGEAVEYGQDLVWVELLATSTPAGDGTVGEA